MIKSIRKDSRISKRNIIRVSSIVKNCLRFCDNFSDCFDRRAFKKWLRDGIFFVVWGNFQVWSDYLLVFLTSGLSFVKKLLGAIFMVIGRVFFVFIFICQMIWGFFLYFYTLG